MNVEYKNYAGDSTACTDCHSSPEDSGNNEGRRGSTRFVLTFKLSLPTNISIQAPSKKGVAREAVVVLVRW